MGGEFEKLEKRIAKLMASGKLEDAEKELRRYLERHPDDEKAIETLAKVLASMAKHEEALKIVDKALKRGLETPELLAQKAIILWQMGDRKEARKLADKAYSVNPSNPRVVEVLASFIEEEDPEKALEILNEALKRNPDNVDLLTRKAEILRFKMNKLDEAERILKGILKRDRDPLALYVMATIHYARNESKKALKLLDEAVAKDPANPTFWFMRGEVIWSFDRWEDALECAERALMLKPDFVEAWILKAEMLYALRRFDEALEAIDRAIQLEPENTRALTIKGLIFETLGRYDEAKALYERALEINPNDLSILRDLARLYRKLGDYNKALEYMGMAEALGEGEYNPDFWLGKGELMEALGRYDEALACYERGLMLSGENERYIRLFTEAIERLRRKRK